MANEDVDLNGLLASVRRQVGALPAGSATAELSSKDYIGLIETEYKAASERGDREERKAQLAVEERKWILEHEEKKAVREHEEAKAVRLAAEAKAIRVEQTAKEVRDHQRVAAYRFGIALVVILVAAFRFADADQRKTIITLTLTSLFGIVTGATGYYFGDKKKDKAHE